MLKFKGYIVAFECNNTLADRVDKRDARRMQHESFAGCTIESIAHNGAIEPILVGCVDTQLMRAAGNGFKADNRARTAIALNSADDLVACHCRLAIDGIDLLTGAVVVIGRKRQVDNAFALLRYALKNSSILFFDFTLCKATLQFLVDLH